VPKQEELYRCFEQDRKISSRSDGENEPRYGDPEDLLRGGPAAESDPLMRIAVVPLLKLDTKSNGYRTADRRHPKKLSHIDDAKAPDLKMLERQVGRGPFQPLANPLYSNRIVSHKPVMTGN